MFCPKCGAQLPDGSVFCSNCGANFNETENNTPATAPAPAQDSPVAKAISFVRANTSKVIAAVAAVLVLILLLTACGGNYKKTVKKYVTAEFNNDLVKMAKLTPFNTNKFAKDVVKEVGEEEDMSKKEVLEEISDELDVKVKKPEKILAAFSKYAKNTQKENFKDNDITGYKMKNFKIKDADKLDDDDIDDIKDGVKDWFERQDLKASDYIKLSKIKKGYEVEVEYEIHYKEDGDKEDQEVETSFIVVKYGAKWLVLDETVLYTIISTGYMVD